MEIKDFETQSIEELKIPWVLCDIHRRKKSGVLHVMGSNKKFGRRIYMVDGEIKFALSNQEGDRLGRILVEKGIITEAQFTKTILKMDGKKRFGQYLIEQGLLSDEQLEDVLMQQTEDIVLSTFDLDSGLFFFEERVLALPTDLQRVFDFPALIIRGIRSLRNLFVLYAEIDEFKKEKLKINFHSEIKIENLPLQPEEAYAFSRVDGMLTLEQLEQLANMDKDQFNKLIFALLCLQVVQAETEKVLDYGNRFDSALDGANLPEVNLKHLNKDQRKDREKIVKKYLEIKNKPYWEFLDLTSNFLNDDLKPAFVRLNKEYHPDICARDHLSDLRPQLNQIISHINLTYHTLSDTSKQREYITSLRDKPLEKPQKTNEEKRQLASEVHAMGKRYLNQEELFNAYRYLEQAVKLCPDDPKFLFDLARVELRNPKWVSKARGRLVKVLELQPTNGKAHFELAKVYIDMEAVSQAINHLKQAAEYDPANHEVFELLDKITKGGKGSFLDRFKKK